MYICVYIYIPAVEMKQLFKILTSIQTDPYLSPWLDANVLGSDYFPAKSPAKSTNDEVKKEGEESQQMISLGQYVLIMLQFNQNEQKLNLKRLRGRYIALSFSLSFYLSLWVYVFVYVYVFI